MAEGVLQIDTVFDDAIIDSFVDHLDSAIDTGLRDAVSQSSALLLNRIRARFLDQVDPQGIPWPVSKAAQVRAEKGIDGGTLFDTGTLFHSIQLFSISPYEQAIGTDVPYAKFHQFGTFRLPIREFLGFSEQDAELALAVLVRNIKAALT